MLKKRRLRQLYPAFLMTLLVALAALGWYVTVTLNGFYLAQTAKDLEARGHLLESLLQDQWADLERTRLDSLCKTLGHKTSTRITLILPQGEVIGDSDEEFSSMDNHAARPEIKEALAGGIGKSIRFSRTLQKRMMYLALPVLEDEKITGVIRTAVPITDLDQVLRAFRNRMLLGMILIAILGAFISLIVARRISQPLKKLRRGAERFAEGQLDYRLAVPDSGEIGSLAIALNRMASQLKDRIDTIDGQRNDQEALLSGMVESVLAITMQRQIISMNQSACRMMGVTLEEARGRSLQRIIRNVDLQKFVEKVLKGGDDVEEDLILFRGEEQYLRAHGTLLRDAQGNTSGVLIVLHDVTRLRCLEQARRDFFANVSHEIKTPLTSIRGYVETLRDSKDHKPEDKERFLEVISKQSDRLTAIIDDLQTLSNIEQGTERGAIPFEKGKLADLLHSVVQACEPNAAKQAILIETVCDQEIMAEVNHPLMEQAVHNLIDNAIRYSEGKNSISVKGGRENSEITITVRDHGIGIAKEHHSRIFERLYRVDKARSRRLGGTGLGLAIVKHIVQAHGGHVSVESAPGIGSTFTIHLSSS